MKIVWIVSTVSALAAVACTVNSTTNNSGTSCNPDSTVSCTTGNGYSCTGSDTPTQGNASLDCGTGIADGTNTDYCCITLQSGTTCASDDTVTGCQSGSFGFSCTGSDTPDQGDSSLTCSSGTPGNAGSTLYCCCDGDSCASSGTDGGTTSTCAADTSVTCPDANATGYQCSGTDSPDQSDSTLNCSAGTADGSNTDYCCITLSSSVTCSADSTVQGCQAGSYGFSCTGTDTPSQDDSNLNCSTGSAGSNGATLYCCSN